MTQYLDGRRGRFWHGSPNGSDAAQWAWTLPPRAGADGVLAGAAFGAAFARAAEPAGRADAGAGLAFPLAVGLALLPFAGLLGLPAAFLLVAGLMGTDHAAIPPRP